MKTIDFIKSQEVKTVGELAFKLYSKRNGGLTWDGKPIPGWMEIDQKTRDNWELSVNEAMVYFIIILVMTAEKKGNDAIARIFTTYMRSFLKAIKAITGVEFLEDYSSESENGAQEK